MCGGKIELVKIIHSKYGGEDVALYCKRCKQIEYGTEPKIYYLAKKLLRN
jgi:hypothetical protein